MTDNISIGVGITTRNRQPALLAGLTHFRAFHDERITYVVVDDSSDEPDEYDSIVNDFATDIPVTIRHSGKRLGIAAAKNACLSALHSCDEVFLFDDDAWARSEGWAINWLAAEREHGIGHSMYIREPFHNHNDIRLVDTAGSGATAMNWWANCMGVALHFSRECLEALGGYDAAGADSVYGYEHAQMSMRARKAGFTGRQPMGYAAPATIADWVFSLDIDHNWHGEYPPLSAIPRYVSSVTPEEAADHERNSRLMATSRVFIPLCDPLPV